MFILIIYRLRQYNRSYFFSINSFMSSKGLIMFIKSLLVMCKCVILRISVKANNKRKFCFYRFHQKQTLLLYRKSTNGLVFSKLICKLLFALNPMSINLKQSYYFPIRKYILSLPEAVTGFLKFIKFFVVMVFHISLKIFTGAMQTFIEASKTFTEAMKTFTEAMKTFTEAMKTFTEAVKTFKEAMKTFKSTSSIIKKNFLSIFHHLKFNNYDCQSSNKFRPL